MKKLSPEVETKRRSLLMPRDGPIDRAVTQLAAMQLVCGYAVWRCRSMGAVNDGVIAAWNRAVHEGAFDKVPERPLPADLFTAYVHYLQRKAAEL